MQDMTGQALPLGPLEPRRYPAESVEVLDPRFKAKIGNAGVERIASGYRWVEGPVYVPAGRYLLWSDIPNSRIMRWLEEDGHVSTFRAPSGNANGATLDREGRVVHCEHARRVVRTGHDGKIHVIAERFEGKRLGAPNDVIVASDGAVWFTDPGYGIDGDYEGDLQAHDLPRAVYRIAPDGTMRVVADDFVRPNGLCFSPDERLLYIVDSGITDGGPAHIRVFDVGSDWSLSHGRIFAEDFVPGFTDGIRCDSEGNIWASMGWGNPAEDGVRCYAPDGTRIGRIVLPETCANICFGGVKRNRMFMAASTSIYAVYLNLRGI